MSGPGGEHRLAWVTAGLHRAARASGVDLPADFTHRVAIDGLCLCDQLSVNRLGGGVVLHTVPDSNRQLPVVLGHADADEAWNRVDSRHLSPSPSASSAVAIRAARR